MRIKISREYYLNYWVEEFSDSLYSWAYHKTNSKETAEDLTQETFISAFKGFDKCKNKEQPKTWLFSILNHKIIDHYRDSAKKTEHHKIIYEESISNSLNGLFEASGSWTEDASALISNGEQHLLDTPEFNDVLANCIADLPENWRMAVISKYILEKKGEEICQELDITPSNYWQLVHRAKVMLKVCIEKNWKE